MATTITRALADAYFAANSHLESAVWLGFGENLRDAAIAHAKRVLNTHFGEDIEDSTVSASAYFQPDYAVYEQALFMLKNSQAIPNGQETAPNFIAVAEDEDDKTRKKETETIAPAALRWLGVLNSKRVEILRG